jgi:hypothetical protein
VLPKNGHVYMSCIYVLPKNGYVYMCYLRTVMYICVT